MTELSLRYEQRRTSASLTQIEKLEAQLKELRRSIAQEHQQKKSGPVTASYLRGIIEARSIRRKIFQEDLFADPAWDILLHLYEDFLDNRSSSTSDVCYSSGVPATTALRWIDKLETSGWVRRTSDPLDGRRVMVGLTHRALESMVKYFELNGIAERGI